jgi:chlorite dismutase/nitrite reductase/ring-hydroxylating ferredoxin subunit
MTSSRPPSSVRREQNPSTHGRDLTKRQYLRFAFYRVDPLWRRLPADEQISQKRELVETIMGFKRRMLLRPYTLMGTRADAELLLWQISETPAVFQELATAIAKTRMGGYLQIAYSYFSQTKRSIYEIRSPLHGREDQLIVQPTDAKYLFVYPFVKTRDWYQMSLPARQGMIDEHIEVGRRYPSVKLNTTYCFGLDDYEFIVAFETDEPSDFLDLVQDLRETEASRYTKQDTPLFTCMTMGLGEALDALGGAAAAEPAAAVETQVSDAVTDVCPLAEFTPGSTRVVYHEGRQVALFNIDGQLFAIGNRCPHARGPLSEGSVSPQECTVVCPWHYAKFDLKTGQVVDGIASSGVETYAVSVVDGMIRISDALQEMISDGMKS